MSKHVETGGESRCPGGQTAREPRSQRTRELDTDIQILQHWPPQIEGQQGTSVRQLRSWAQYSLKVRSNVICKGARQTLPSVQEPALQALSKRSRCPPPCHERTPPTGQPHLLDRHSHLRRISRRVEDSIPIQLQSFVYLCAGSDRQCCF